MVERRSAVGTGVGIGAIGVRTSSVARVGIAFVVAARVAVGEAGAILGDRTLRLAHLIG